MVDFKRSEVPSGKCLVQVPTQINRQGFNQVSVWAELDLPIIPDDVRPVAHLNGPVQFGSQPDDYVPFDGYLWLPTQRTTLSPNDNGFANRIAHDRVNGNSRERRTVSGRFPADRLPYHVYTHELPEELDAELTAKAAAMQPRLAVHRDRIYQRTYGPLLVTQWLGSTPTPSFQVSPGRTLSRILQAAPLTFSALDKDRALDMIGRRMGMPKVSGNQVVLLGDFDAARIEKDLSDIGMERAVWHFLGEIQERRLDGVPRDAMVAAIRARSALEQRWPRLELRFGKSNPNELGDHVHDFDVPDAADLMPVLQSVADACDGWLSPTVVAAWRLQLERRLNQAPSFDELAGFAL